MKSILIIGLGRFGRHMAAKFIEEGNSVLAIGNGQTMRSTSLIISRSETLQTNSSYNH